MLFFVFIITFLGFLYLLVLRRVATLAIASLLTQTFAFCSVVPFPLQSICFVGTPFLFVSCNLLTRIFDISLSGGASQTALLFKIFAHKNFITFCLFAPFPSQTFVWREPYTARLLSRVLDISLRCCEPSDWNAEW